jgi:hypothetical protein
MALPSLCMFMFLYFSFVVDLIFPGGLMYFLNEPHRLCNSDRAHIRCGTLWLQASIGSNQRLYNWYLVFVI